MRYEININKITIDPQGKYNGKNIQDFLDSYYISAKKGRQMIAQKQILLQNQPIKNNTVSIDNQPITIRLPEEQIDWPLARKECHVLYDDPFLFLVHKEPGYIIHGDPDDITCLNAQAARYLDNHHIHIPVRPIHRLDKETTGIVFYSKIPFFQPWFDKQLAEKKIKRHYYAICKGKMPKQRTFTCSLPIGKDRHINGKYRVSSTGKEAVTHFECIKQIGPYVLVSCQLETGRTHQIRVHLSHLQLPIVNDIIYGVQSTDFSHMCLWADEITFHSPLTNKRHKIKDIQNPDFEPFFK